MSTTKDVVRIAAVGDIHCTTTSQGVLQPLFAKANEQADVLLLCGDLTDYGLAEEVHVLINELATTTIPTLAVLGNHDYESGRPEEVRQILAEAGIKPLDGEACEVAGIGFAGVKGFAGGFGSRMLQPWGEELVKQFVHEAAEEALKLESALAKLDTEQKVAVLHYSPIQETVEGEPCDIVPFLGSSRLEDPLNRFSVAAALHGHAHHGYIEGRTSQNIPVYNVAMPLLKKHFPEQPPFRLLEIPLLKTQEKVG
ncbi:MULTISPECIES: metallophosphoesterase [unclassified Leptolyngbya]|uniref:metallophosphoesterase family protein n=1 Tax=unclassified Leptolyngbya TaxID=2650499 RepID=UPI0016841EA7|nr:MULTISPECIES: metallophosphoesterase [unclassified Leptolyngbya]MBD1911112.1 metallophosphoesterase [Leptolyngbya sp. FACHB-8]MBD2153974.1 metallophosphoesterase [Leptolyngbya sp. FACHB-16]